MTKKKPKTPKTAVPVMMEAVQPRVADDGPGYEDGPTADGFAGGDERFGKTPLVRLTPEQLVERYPEHPADGFGGSEERFGLTGGQLLDMAAVVELAKPQPHPDATPAIVPGVVGVRPDQSAVWVIDRTWIDRLERMADSAGLPPDKFLDTLLRRAWVGLPLSKRGHL